MDKSKQSATEPTIPNERFVSCIKIRGYRILPPLVCLLDLLHADRS